MNNSITILDLMRYYVAYYDIEKPILDAISSNNRENISEGMRKYMGGYMKISRNFKGKNYLKIYDITKEFYDSKNTNIESLSALFHKMELLSGINKNAKVASSKLLWLFNRNVVIMDNFNKKVLNVKTDNYSDYLNRWETEFQNKKKEIDQIILSHDLKSLDNVFSENWFKMRVFDQYLWTLNEKGITL